jgi:sulfatase modifying factor 1
LGSWFLPNSPYYRFRAAHRGSIPTSHPSQAISLKNNLLTVVMRKRNLKSIIACGFAGIFCPSICVGEDPVLPGSILFKDIPGGSFSMGGTTIQNDAPFVSVTLSAFRISEKEITNQEYLDFLNASYSDGWITVAEQSVNDPCGMYSEMMIYGSGGAPNAGEVFLQLGETGGCTSDGQAEHIDNKSWISFDSVNSEFILLDDAKSDWPVNWVKWYGAYAFAQYYGVELPSEAQWEYAARGGQQFEYPTDDGSLDSSKAIYNGDSPGVYSPDGHSVAGGSYPANPYGLYDMGGNVWEWCQDYYSESFYLDGTTDPLNTTAGADAKRVRRGGSWNYHSATLLTYARASDFENRGNNHFGFRIASDAASGLPIITAQPQDVSISSGATATLSVTATDAISYQWYSGTSGDTASPVAAATEAAMTVSPTMTTSYWVRIAGSGESLDSETATVTVSEGTAYDTWVLANPTLTDPGQQDDPDADGIRNLIEFALGLNPMVFDSIPVLMFEGLTSVDASFEVHYIRPDGGVEGITYEIESSIDLINWASEVESTVTVTGDGFETVIYEFPKAALSFLRLRVWED